MVCFLKQINRSYLFVEQFHSILRYFQGVSRLFSMACVSLCLLVMVWPGVALAERVDINNIHGLWVDHQERDKRKVAIWIDDCDSLLCGKIYWLKKPLTANGNPKLDRHNPDVAFRGRVLCGLKILTGFRLEKERTWNGGQIYNPSDGQIFSSTMNLENDGSLKVRGYVGLSLFGKTVVWVRPEENMERCF